MLDSLIFSFQRGLEMIWRCHHSNVPGLGQTSWCHDDWLPSMESVAWVLPLEETGDPSLVDSWRTKMMDMIPGMIPETFKELFMSTKQFNWFHYWFLNATYTCIMHRSIESIRTDSCPNKMHLYFPRPNANMTKRPLPRINHDTVTPSYNLNNMKHHKLHKPWQTMTNHEYQW